MSDRIRAGVLVITKRGVLVGHPTGHPKDSWDIFKGHVDSMETTVACALRELQEESGIIIHKEDIEYIGSLRYEGDHLVLFKYEVDDIDIVELRCNSLIDRGERKGLPEVDGYRFMAYEEVIGRYHGLRL